MKQDILQRMLAQAGRAGVYHLPHSGRDALDETAERLGFACFKVNLRDSADPKVILEALGRDLHFPDWYGANLDALHDCLTDFSWRDAPGYLIVLTGAEMLHADHSRFAALNDVFAGAIEQWRTRNVPLWVFLRPSRGWARCATHAGMTMHKRPISVLVVIHTRDLHVLLLERASHPGFWQSVTGSQEDSEALIETAAREVHEETGIAAAPSTFRDWRLVNTFEIFSEWRYRYAPGVTHNAEHVFSLEVPTIQPVRIAPAEHLDYCWLPWREAAEKCFSWSNRDAILMLPERTAR